MLLAAACIGLLAHSASSTVASRNAAIQSLEAQIAKVQPVQTAPTSSAPRLTALTTIADGRPKWDGFLFFLSRVVPEDVWLLSLTASAPPTTPAPAPTAASSAPAPAPAPAAATPSTVLFTGYTYSQPSVARMMRRLQLVPWLQDVNLVNSTKTAIDQHTVYQFTLGANFISLPEVGT